MRYINARNTAYGEDRRTYKESDSGVSSTQRVFNVSYDNGRVEAYLNGVRLFPGDDYTKTSSGIGTSITLASDLGANNVLEIVGYQGINSGNALVEDNFVVGTGSTGSGGSYTNSTTVFPVVSSAGDTVSVWRNGIKLVPTTDYTVQASANTVTLVSPASSADEITVQVVGGVIHNNGLTVNSGNDSFFLPTTRGTDAYVLTRDDSVGTGGTAWKELLLTPIVSSISPTNIEESDTTQTIVITGSNFDGTASAVLIDNNGTTKTPTTSTRNSDTQITIVFSGSDVLADTVPQPLDVRVTQGGSSLSATLENALTIDAKPVWQSPGSGNNHTLVDQDYVEDEAITQVNFVATDPEGQTVTYTHTSGLPNGLTLSSAGALTGTINHGGTYNASGQNHNFTVTADDGTGNTEPRSFTIVRKWRDGSTSALASNSPDYLRSLGLSDGVYYFKFPNFNSGNAFQARFASYPNNNPKGWIEVLISQDTNIDTPWSTNGWLSNSSSNFAYGHDGDLSGYHFVSNNTSSGGIDYTANKSSIALGTDFTPTDFAITSKSSRTANGVAATGANQGSVYPLTKSNLAATNSTVLSNLTTAMLEYWIGKKTGFHADYGNNAGGGGVDYTGGFQFNSGNYFEIVLAYRNGSVDSTEWHIADGSSTSGGTYFSNCGYRNQQNYASAFVGAWSDNTTTKGSTYNIGSSNVLSVWITNG